MLIFDVDKYYKNQVGIISFVLLLCCSYQLYFIKEYELSILFLFISIFSGCADSHSLSNDSTRFLDKCMIFITLIYFFLIKCHDDLSKKLIISLIFPFYYSRLSKDLSTWVLRHHLWHSYIFTCINYYVYYRINKNKLT